MDNVLHISHVSKESLFSQLEWVDRVLVKLEKRHTSYVAPDISKDDLIDIFVEARVWLLMQLEALGESDANEINRDTPSAPLDYVYSVEAIRNRIRDGW